MDKTSYWVYVIISLIVLVGGTVTLFIVRKKFYGNSSKMGASEAFTLDEIGKMKQNGQLSEEEYKSLRARIVQRMT